MIFIVCCMQKNFLCYEFCLHVSINVCISAEFKCLLLETFNSRDQNTYTQVNEFCLSCHNQFFKWAINWQKHHIPQSWVAKDLTISLQKHANIWETNSNAACTQNEEKKTIFLYLHFIWQKVGHWQHCLLKACICNLRRANLSLWSIHPSMGVRMKQTARIHHWKATSFFFLSGPGIVSLLVVLYW